MKANELMIGDFVFHEIYGNAIIENIDNDFGDNPAIRLISENIKQKTGYKYGYCWCDLTEIFPIPLTPEILEKNGFVKAPMVSDTPPYDKDEEGYIHFSLNGNFWGWWQPNNTFLIPANGLGWLEFKYIHELQHALRLCGIEKSIEL